MRKLKCFFLMLVLSFSLLSSSVVFAAETETSVRPIYSYNKIRLDALSEEEKNTIINLVNSDAPYLAFFRTSSLFPNRYLEAFFFFYPERFEGEWKENGLSVRNFILTRYFFGCSSVSPCPLSRIDGQKNIRYNGKERGQRKWKTNAKKG